MSETGSYVRAVRIDIEDNRFEVADPTGSYVIEADALQWSLGTTWALVRGVVTSDLICQVRPVVWLEVPLEELPTTVLAMLLRTARS